MKRLGRTHDGSSAASAPTLDDMLALWTLIVDRKQVIRSRSYRKSEIIIREAAAPPPRRLRRVLAVHVLVLP